MPADTPQTISGCRECSWNPAGESGLCKRCEGRVADTPMVLVPGKWTRSVEEYLAHYGSGCRDCADEAGACPASGMTCDFDQRMAAFRHALKAINYGVKQGYLALSPSPAQGEGDAPVSWQARIKPDGEWFHVSEPYAERRRAEAGIEMRPLFTRPTPATPEGLREKIIAAIYDNIEITSRASLMGADKAADAILAALQPQAQGGE